MAETSFPFENQSTSEGQYSLLFRNLADTGVIGSAATADLKPYGDSSGMFVKLPYGQAVVRGFYYLNDAPISVAVPPAGSSARTDSLVLRLDPAADQVAAAVKQGTAGGPPALTQVDGGVWEVRLADVAVPAGSTGVTAGQVTDRRSYSSLPWGKWTTDLRPAAAAANRGKAGFNETTGQPEWSDGAAWRSFSTTTTDAGALTSGTLANARLDYGVVAAVRGDRGVDAPLQGDAVNGDWNSVLQPGAYRVGAGNANGNAPAGANLYGTLAVFGAGSAVSSRSQLYMESGGAGLVYHRTAWNGNDWGPWQKLARGADLDAAYGQYDGGRLDGRYYTQVSLDPRLAALEANAAGTFTPATGWAVQARANVTRRGYAVAVDLSLKRTGGNVASGKITNAKLGDISYAASTGQPPLVSGSGGPTASGYVSGTAVYLAATTGGINTGQELTLGGTFLL